MQGEVEQAEEVFRIGIQYAQEGLAAADLFRRLGDALLKSGRAGEAVGPLRRATAFGAPASEIYPLLGKALLERKRCLKELGKQLDIPDEVLMSLPSVEDIQQRAERAKAKLAERQARSQTVKDSKPPPTEREWGI